MLAAKIVTYNFPTYSNQDTVEFLTWIKFPATLMALPCAFLKLKFKHDGVKLSMGKYRVKQVCDALK